VNRETADDGGSTIQVAKALRHEVLAAPSWKNKELLGDLSRCVVVSHRRDDDIFLSHYIFRRLIQRSAHEMSIPKLSAPNTKVSLVAIRFGTSSLMKNPTPRMEISSPSATPLPPGGGVLN
jgi:hypothetical protein